MIVKEKFSNYGNESISALKKLKPGQLLNVEYGVPRYDIRRNEKKKNFTRTFRLKDSINLYLSNASNSNHVNIIILF